MSHDVKKASEIVSNLFNQIDSDTAQTASRFISFWAEIAGADISAHSKVIDVDKGMILVEVDHPGWSQMLSFNKKRILHALDVQFPELKLKNMVIRIHDTKEAPYTLPKKRVGEGVKRDKKEDEPDIAVKENLDEPLKEVLLRLKNSIRKGKDIFPES